MVSSLDHFVTQWMSTVTVSDGSARNSSHARTRARSTAPSIEKLHCSSGRVRRRAGRQNRKIDLQVLPGRDPARIDDRSPAPAKPATDRRHHCHPESGNLSHRSNVSRAPHHSQIVGDRSDSDTPSTIAAPAADGTCRRASEPARLSDPCRARPFGCRWSRRHTYASPTRLNARIRSRRACPWAIAIADPGYADERNCGAALVPAPATGVIQMSRGCRNIGAVWRV